MSVPTIPELKGILEKFENARYNGVPGILHFDSGKPGPTLGITACTHGNEPAGIAAFKWLLEECDIQETLLSGQLFLVVNNLEAARSYLFEGNSLARYVDINMNRLPEDVLSKDQSDKRSEVCRARELAPVWGQFTHGLDIHSTRADIRPMVIGRENLFHLRLLRGLPIETLISNIDRVQLGKPAFAFYGELHADDAYVFGIEAGTHEAPESFERAIATVRALLQNLEMLDGVPQQRIEKYTEYRIVGSIIVPNLSYKLTERVADFEPFEARTVLAISETDEDFVWPKPGCIMMKKNPRNADELTEEIAFISELPKERLL